MRYIKKKSNGFTLVELLIVSALISIIGLAVYSVLSSGIRIWQRVNIEMPTQDLNIFLDKFSLDLRNSIEYKDLNFIGSKDQFEFATLLENSHFGGRTPAKVRYYYNYREKKLYREELDYSQIFNGDREDGTESLANIESLQFSYYFYDKESNAYSWLDKWPHEILPAAVRIEMKLNGVNQNNSFTKTVTIPISG